MNWKSVLPVAIQSTWAAFEDGSEAILGPECCGRSSNELKVIFPWDMFNSGAVLVTGCFFYLYNPTWLMPTLSWNPI